MKTKTDEPVRTIYYSDERNDEFAGDNIKAKVIDEHYRYVDQRLRWRLGRFIAYRLIAMPIAFLYCKIALHSTFRNRKVLKQAKGTGCFVYGNHTQQIGDPFLPNLALFPRSVYVIVHPNNVSMPVLGRINPYLGALPLPSNLKAMRNFREAIRTRIREDNYQNRLNRVVRSADRVEILERIAKKEAEGRFDEDVEDDPPSPVLKPEDIDYLHKGFIGNCKRRLAFAAAYHFFGKLEKNRDIVVRPAQGLEHLAGVSGAVITCNHFHPMDSFIMQRVFDASGHPKRLYRVIREGNYTNFPGFYGFLMRHCNTLPLSSNLQTMKKFLTAVKQVLSDGNCLLIYPEQSLWWNYRRPKPMKSGAFDMAVKNKVPVVPCFITMRDTDKLGADGFPIQEYTPHLGAPIWPDESLPKSVAREKLKHQTEEFCRRTYEAAYGISFSYPVKFELSVNNVTAGLPISKK